MSEKSKTQSKSPRKPLTAAFVRTVKEAGRYGDGNGLILRVEPSGSKRWIQRIVIRGKRTDIGLGSASLVTLAEAREAALSNRKLARSGGDPLADKTAAQAILTFEQAAREVHRINLPTWRNAKHGAQFISTLQTYAFPRLGSAKVSDITTADVLAVLQPIWLKKPETARRVRQRIGTVLKWAIAQGWRQDDPTLVITQALPKQDRTVKHRVSMPYDDVAAFLEVMKNSGAGNTTKLALEFLILTATRSGETRNAVWSEIDFNTATWIIPAQRMKAKKEHRIPLSDRALEILAEAKALNDGSDLIFAGTRYGKPLSDMTLSKLVKENGFTADIHGFRTSFKTWTQERTNTAREVSEVALAHTIQNKAEAAYARSDLFEKRRALMGRWATYLDFDPVESKIISLG
jgi:integrase